MATQLPLPNKITELKVKAKSCTCAAIFQAATFHLECYASFPYSHTFLLVAVLHFIWLHAPLRGFAKRLSPDCFSLGHSISII